VYNKEPNHADGSPSGRFMIMEVVNVLGQNNSNDDMASSHSNGTDYENRLAAQTIDPQDCWHSCNEHGNTHNTSCKEARGVLTQPQLAEDLGGIVEDLDSVS
jgi:hypothetical protein